MFKQQPVGADLRSSQSSGQAPDAPIESLVVIGIPLVKFDERLHLIIFSALLSSAPWYLKYLADT
jgi:hypothetical protein